MTVNRYHAAFEYLYKSDWYRFPRVLFKLKVKTSKGKPFKLKTEAYTFAAALNQSSWNDAALKTEGWINFSSKIAEEDTSFSRETQNRHLGTLIDCGLIDRRRAPKENGGREIRINYELLVDLILEVASHSSGIPTSDRPHSSRNDTSARHEMTQPNSNSIKNLEDIREEREPGPRSPTGSVSSPNGKTSQKRASFTSKSTNRTYPDFCKVLAERLLKILQSRRPQIHVDAGTVESRPKHIYELWVEFGKDDDAKEKLSTQLDRLEEGINYIGFEIGSIAQFHQWYNRINDLLNKQDSPKDEDGKKIGKIYWDTLEIEEWIKEILPNGNELNTLKKFKVKKSYRWEITQGDNGRPEFDKVWIDNPRTVSNDW